MEKQLNSSGIFPRIFVIEDSSGDPTRFGKNIKPEEFTDRVIFMSMFNDIDWSRRGNDEISISNAEKVKYYAKRFLQGHWTFLGPGSEKKWYGGSSYPPKGEWDSTANEMGQRSKETVHPVFKNTSALSRGILKKKKDFETIQFNGDSSNTELLFHWAWQRKIRDEIMHLWTRVYWHVCHHMTYNFWYLLRQWHRETVCKNIFWTSKHCSTEFTSQNCVKTLGLNIVFPLVMTTVGEDLFHSVGNTHFLEDILNPESLHQFLVEQLLDQFWKLKTWKFLDSLDLRFQFNQLSNTKRHLTLWLPEERSVFWMKFMTTKTELRSSTELLSALQK